MFDCLQSQMYLEKLTRDRLQFKTNPNVEWNTYTQLKKSFATKHPELAPAYKEFEKNESSKWRDLFSENFKKHSLATFVLHNVDPKTYVY